MQTGNEKIVYIDGKGFNILEVDDQLLKDLFNQLVRESGNCRWCPTKEEIEEICCETYKRRLYELNTIYSHRKNLMLGWDNWSWQVDYCNKVHYGTNADYGIGGIHILGTPDPSNDWYGQITIDPNSLTYPSSGITYNAQEFDRLYTIVNNIENVWENWQYAEPRHGDFQSMVNQDGDIIHRYMFYVEHLTSGGTTAVEVYINTRNFNVSCGAIDRFYGRLRSYIYGYVQGCDIPEFIRLHKVIWENGTMSIYNTYGEIVFALNDISMEV